MVNNRDEKERERAREEGGGRRCLQPMFVDMTDPHSPPTWTVVDKSCDLGANRENGLAFMAFTSLLAYHEGAIYEA